MTLQLLHGDCVEILATLPAESIDACVTDPPYGIGFMGREWDTFKPGESRASKGLHPNQRIGSTNPNLRGRRRAPTVSPSQIEYDYSVTGLRAFQIWTEAWGREVLRVLKPGGHAVVCGAPRAYHRMASGLEDAGFEIRDCLAWLFGSGFPKSLNLGEGLGTALKPAHEPIVLARKPFKGSVRANVDRHGTGALNIDACRIGANARPLRVSDYKQTDNNVYQGRMDGSLQGGSRADGTTDLGRWPANVCLDECAAAVLDEQSGASVSRAGEPRAGVNGDGWGMTATGAEYDDVGGASRFYYVAKPSREERDMGCGSLPARSAGECTARTDGSAGLQNPRAGAGRTNGGRNFHPTVKPVELMRWLVRLVTPIDGVVLDPFLGSGTTGMACRYELRSFIGIEREAEYLAIAERRIAAVAPLFGALAGDPRPAGEGSR